MNDNANEDSENEDNLDKEKKKRESPWTIRKVSTDIREKITEEANNRNQPIADYLSYLVTSHENSITGVSKEARDAALRGSESLGITIPSFMDMVLLNQNTTIRNVDHEALSAATMVASRANIPLSQFVSNAILKEAHDVLQGKHNKPVAVIPSEEIMTVGQLETFMKDFKSEMIEIIKEVNKESSIPKEKFFNKIKEKIFK